MAHWRSNDYHRTLRTANIDPGELEYFRSQALTKMWLDNPRYSPVISPPRIPKTDDEDEFFGKTLQTDDTIKNWLSLVSNAAFPPPGSISSTKTLSPKPGAETPEAMVFFNLQSGVNGFPGVAHGGLLCALLDEAMGFVVELHRHTSSSTREELYTASLNINYRRPVKTPDTVIAKTWLEKREGRRWIVRGLLENSKGERCVDVDGLWVTARPQQL